jgi:hypothetical protein
VSVGLIVFVTCMGKSSRRSTAGMDLVVPSSDDESTLQAVLAFVEGYERADDSIDALPSVSTPIESRQVPRARTAKYTTQLQRRKRAEAAALREEVEGLEALLAQIQRVHVRETKPGVRTNQSDGAEPETRWRQLALVEHQKRRRAEILNGKLRVSLQRHRALGDAVLNVLRKSSGNEVRSSPICMSRVNMLKSRGCVAPCVQVNDLAVVDASVSTHGASLRAGLGLSLEAELQRGVAQLHAELHFVFQPELFLASVVSRVNSSFEIVREISGGVAYIEVRTSTPVEHSQQETAQMIWRDRVLSGQRTCPNKRHAVVSPSEGR